MTDLHSQVPYWDGVSATKTFTHPLHLPWLDGIDRQAAILDYGCGYGRVMEELERHGFTGLTGVDTSPGMIERARGLHPAMRFAVLDAPPVSPFQDGEFDAVLLFAVLTCVPDTDAQHRLVGEVARVLRPGGLLYVSDYPLQEDARNRARYERDAARFDDHGVFETSEGAVFRHHTRERLDALLAGFDVVGTRTAAVSSMNGHDATALQFLARKPR
ncbi:class I SAM-dependent methyltransferase [Streptomyces sp. NPDC050095]|uniref:class I SAM-dependent methyltransferase n=1 Tax=unclassified Streptomyces TaxID=2593676 RepID=UPI00344842C8